jgi:two-component system repressor protein LuxO
MSGGASPRLAACRVLIVEDSDAISALYTAYLEDSPWHGAVVATALDAKQSILTSAPSLILLDLTLPDAQEFELFDWIRANAPLVDILVLTGHGSIDRAVRALQSGAVDFLEKPISRDRLLLSVRNALECLVLRQQVNNLLRDYGRDQFRGFVGASVAMQGIYRMVEAVSRSSATIFITGESGTGKEVCAQAIHQESQHAQGPFVAVNCSAIAPDLLESELFGRVSGALNGAPQAHEGAAEQANRGTLFLDEIGELNLDLQGKLLRFLQTNLVKRVGSTQERKVDARIICATNRDPWSEVRAGRFREDLYYRLNVIPIRLPPLRERGEDVVLLARSFLRSFAREEGKHFDGFTAAALERIRQHRWPGNVRELQNAIRRAVVFAPGGQVEAAAIALDPSEAPGTVEPIAVSVQPKAAIEPLAVTERRAVEGAISACGGNIPQAARLLEVSASTLYRKLQLWGVESPTGGGGVSDTLHVN